METRRMKRLASDLTDHQRRVLLRAYPHPGSGVDGRSGPALERSGLARYDYDADSAFETDYWTEEAGDPARWVLTELGARLAAHLQGLRHRG